MCDTRHHAAGGWQGWLDLPATEVGRPTGPWIDLSHPLHRDMPRAAIFPAPRFERILSLPSDPLNVTEMQMCVHTGTHVDAPRHFFTDGPAFHEIEPHRLCGPGVVWRVRKEPGQLIEPQDLEAARPLLEPGDIVVLDTGWWHKAGHADYDDHPSLSAAAARWLVEHRVKLLGVDLPTPDLPLPRRSTGFDWPVHHVLLAHGVLVSEHLTNLDALVGQRVEFVFLALNIQDSDGAPARVMARRIAAG